MHNLKFYCLIVIYRQVWVYSEGHRHSFIEECIVRDLAWLLSIILMLNVLVQTVNIICGVVTMFNLYIPE